MKWTTEESKKRFLEYYRELPIQKLAAGFARVNEDTVTNWKNDDSEFSDALEAAKSDWAMGKAKKVRDPNWMLERVLKKEFSPRTELTGADGKDLPTPIIDVSNNNSDTKDKGTQ